MYSLWHFVSVWKYRVFTAVMFWLYLCSWEDVRVGLDPSNDLTQNDTERENIHLLGEIDEAPLSVSISFIYLFIICLYLILW